MRIGVFGGTFDPIHHGHLRAAEEVAERLRLERVYFIPSARPPHRGRPQATAPQRLAMVKLAIRSQPRFKALDWELKRPGKSYTTDTLHQLKTAFPRAELFLIIGTDQALELGQWHEPDRLFKLAHVVAISRPGSRPIAIKNLLSRQGLSAFQERFSYQPVTILDISSTDIRRRIKAGLSIQYLVPTPVVQYLKIHHLYRSKP